MGVDYSATVGYGVLLEPDDPRAQNELVEELCSKAKLLEGPDIGYATIGVSSGYGGKEYTLVGHVWSTSNYDPQQLSIPNEAFLDEVDSALRAVGLTGARWYFGLSCW